MEFFKKSTSIIFQFCLFLLVFTASCIKEDNLHRQKQNYIQESGYLPLAPDNTWIYETWLANYNTNDGTYTYEPNSIPSQTSISSMNINNNKNQIEYKFSPFADSFLGGLLGNFNEIVYKDNKYYRNTDIDLSNGNNDVSFNVTKGILLDENAKIGDMIYAQSDSMTSNIGTLVKIKYNIRTYVTGKYDKMPDYLTRTPGIDDQLKKYTDIIKVTDSISIEKIEFHLNSIKLDFSAKLEVTGGNGKTNLFTTGRLGGWAFVIILPNPIPIPAPIDLIQGELTASFTPQVDIICPAEGIINVNETINQKFDLVSNDTPIHIDSYFSKGVGKIKTITNIEQVNGVIKVDKFRNDHYTINLQIKSTNPSCEKYEANNATINVNLDAILDGINLSIPISGGLKSDIVQNLTDYYLRKTLN